MDSLFVCLAAIILSLAGSAHAQYIGVTCGYQYSPVLTGPPANPGQYNQALYNLEGVNQYASNNPTWGVWVEQLQQAGVDFVCPNCTGSYPNTNGPPSQIAPMVATVNARGLTSRLKFGLFDDNAASWVAQWNLANGRGYDYAQKFDMADTNNWKYLYDYNYKIFFQTVPDTNRFKISGRPVIIIWTGNAGAFLTNMQGNVSLALTYVRQCCQRDFGFNPYIVLSKDFFSNDTTLTNPGIADASQGWFIAGPSGPSYTLTTRNNVSIGVAVAEFHNPSQSGYLDPNHGQLLQTGLSGTVGAGALLTLCEGFTDYDEDAALWRVRDLDANGNILNYTNTLYDYPNQRLNLLRQNGNHPFPVELKLEAEGCDVFGGAAGGNGKINYYRNGNIAIETNSDTGGGYDVGWIQPGEWLEWEQVPIQGSLIHLQVRVASTNNNGQLHFTIDGTNYPPLRIPNTGGLQTWATVDSGITYQFGKGSMHTVRLVCDTGGYKINYWQYHDDIPIGERINLQAKANSKWVSASNATLNAGASVVGINEAFTVVDASSIYGYGYVALQAQANGNYVTADTNGLSPLIANATSVGTTQIFEWADNGDGTIFLRAVANSLTVSATNNPSSYPLIPNRIRSNVGLPETFAVTQASSIALSFVSPPNNAVAGGVITAGGLGEVQVLVSSNSTSVAGVVVTLSLASGNGSLTGNSATTDSNGIAYFPDLTVNATGTKTLQASGNGVPLGISSTFNITPGVASALTVETAPDGSGVTVAAQNIMAGTSINVFAIVRDLYGNFITNMPAAWSLTNLTGGVVSGDLVSSADKRSAIFTGHVIGSAVIKAVATLIPGPSQTSATSGTMVVGVNTVAGLIWSTQPGKATNGFVFGTSPVIKTVDVSGNVTTSGLPAVKYIAVAIYSGTGTLFGTVITNIGTLGANGTLTLTNLGINSLGTFTLRVQDLGNAFNPTNITGAGSCQLWLDAADTNTLNSSVIGSAITQWKDKSGHANHAAGAATLAINPLLTATSPGKAQTIHFNGSQQLTMNLNSLSNSPYTILVMEVGASKASGSSYFIGNNGGFNKDLTLGIGYQSPSQFRWQQYSDDLNYNTTLTNITARQWTMNLNATPTKNLYLNSTLVGTAASAYLTGPNLVSGTVGYNSYLGDLAEVVVYNTSLSLNDQTNLQNYLNNKWLTGLSAATTLPFTVVAPVYYPLFSNITIGKSNAIPVTILLTGSGGPPSGGYRILSTTNLTAPIAAWVPVRTNQFDTSGTFSNTIPVNTAQPANFYRLIRP